MKAGSMRARSPGLEGTISHASGSVVIAGAGIVGSSTAFFLAQKHKVRPVLIDASYPAASASGKAGGFLAYSWSDGSATQQLAREGFSLHKAWSESEFTDVDYRFGIDAMSGMLPEKGDSSPVYRYIGSDRRACGQVHPKKLTDALCARVEAMGGEVHSSTMLTEVLLDASKTQVVGVRVQTEKGEEVISTDCCVLTLGAWTSVTLAAVCDVQVAVPRVVGHKVHSVVVKDTREVGRQVSASLFLMDGATGAEPEAYPRPDGTVYVCGNQGSRRSYDSTPPRLASDVDVEDDGSVDYLRAVSSVLLDTEDRYVEVQEAQACYLPVSSSNKPVISAVPGIEGLYINAGHSCWGILQGPVSGMACAELIATGTSTKIDLQPFTLM